MTLRDVVITATINERIGDETYELWLKRASGAWYLEATGAVEPVAATQDFTINDLDSDVLYAMQLRMRRAGRYHISYLTSDPSTWPAQSYYEFTPGISDAMSAPTMDSISWERTSSTVQRIDVTVTPTDLGFDIQLLRDGTVVQTVAGPFAGTPIVIYDDNPPAGADHTYTARHVNGFIAGPSSGALTQWPGPTAPTGLVDASVSNFYEYTVNWTNTNVAAVTRVEDDYAHYNAFDDRGAAAAGATSFTENPLPKSSTMASNGNLTGTIGVRVRHEWTQFGSTDVSKWLTLPTDDVAAVVIQYSPDETMYDTTRPM